MEGLRVQVSKPENDEWQQQSEAVTVVEELLKTNATFTVYTVSMLYF